MKVFVEYDFKNESGKGKFCSRLRAEWDRTGVEYSDTAKGCDVRLSFIKFRTECKLPTVLRLDGSHNELHMNEKKQAWKNRLCSGFIKKSKAVIWQSEFCRKMGHVVFADRPRKEYVIFNGADPAEFLPWNPGKNVLLSAYWKERPHKRLAEMLDVARIYTARHPDVFFHVLGDAKDTIKSPNIIFHGYLSTEKMKQVFSKCACMLNICYADWCPNAVVEALVAGMPVICTAGHGVSEIVRNSGIVVDIDDPIDKKHFYRAMNKPIRDIQPVYDALDAIFIEKRQFPKPEHLYIGKIARKYYEVCKEVYDGCR